VDANFAGLVNVWAYVPDGWQVRFEEDLQVNVVATPGTPPGDYTVQLVGQPQAHPDVIETVNHTVTIPDADSLELGWAVEPNITIPMGEALLDDVSNQTNDAQPEIPDSAFRLAVSNHSGQARTIGVTVGGAPAGWLVLNGRQQDAASFTLGPNERTQVGLYVVPPTLPAPGTSFNMNVAISDGNGGADSAIIPWSMSGQAHNFMQLSPDTLYLGPNQSGDFTLEMSNVGNQAGSFPVDFAIPLTAASISGVQSPLALDPAETHIQTATISIAADAPHGRYPLTFSSPAPGSYTQYDQIEVLVLTENAGEIAAAAACVLDQAALAASLQSLALAADELEVSCDGGDCSIYSRDRTVEALESVIHYANITSPHLTVIASLQNIANDLAGHTESPDILADLDNLAATAMQLGAELCEVGQHLGRAQFSPYLDAILLGETAVLTLTVSNLGSLETSYAVTATTPTGEQTFNPTIQAGEAVALPVSTTPAQLGSYDILAEVAPTGPDVTLDMTETALARLNVVDKFVQVTAVSADPPFVETGVSSTTLSVEVANVAGIQQDVMAQAEILAPRRRLAVERCCSPEPAHRRSARLRTGDS
jgi:hypothetical protein